MEGRTGHEEKGRSPVRAKVFLIDPGNMSVYWMNEPASRDLPSGLDPSSSGVKLDRAVPLSKDLGLHEALSIVAETGTPQHRKSDLISSSRGIMLTAASAYLLPDGKLLLITEVSWQVRKRDTGVSGIRSGVRR
ncbi:MAG: hypothetical protein ACMUHY_01755 [Thermoplasmatota archaeon]